MPRWCQVPGKASPALTAALGLVAAVGALLIWGTLAAEAQPQFVAVGATGRILTSPDGVAWTQQTSGTTQTLHEVAYGGGRWVAVGSSSTVRISTDGITWGGPTTAPAPSTTLYGIAHGNGQFITVGTSGRVFTSPDGATWTLRTTPTTASLYSIGLDELTGTWIVRTSTTLVLRSTDGVTWSSHTFPFTGAALAGGVDHGAGLWVITGTSGQLATSPTGTSWTTVPAGNFPFTGSVRGVAHDQAGLWIAAGFNGIAGSASGTLWTARTHPGTHGAAPAYQDVAFTPNGPVWVVAGTSGRIAYSTNGGTTWTAATSPTTSTLNGLGVRLSLPDPATTHVGAVPGSIVANGATTSAVVVRLRDAGGNFLTTGGQTVTLATTRGTLGPVADHGNGTYTATLTSGTVAGPAIVSGTLNGQPITMQATVQFVAGPPAAATSTVDAVPGSIVANGASTSLVTIALRDQHGNALAVGGALVTAATTGGTLGPLTDLANGQYTATLTSPTATGSATVSATVDGATIADTATVAFVPGPASAATSLITATPSSILANGATTSLVTVRLRDAHGNALVSGGDPVAAAASHGTLGTLNDNGDGTYSALLTSSTVAGPSLVTGTLAGTPLSASFVVTFHPGPVSLAHSALAAAPGSIVLTDPAPTAQVTLRLRDLHGNLVGVGGHAVALATTHGALGSTVDHANGTYTATLATTVAGTASVSAIVGSAAVPATATVQFLPGPLSLAHAAIVPTPASIVADGASTASVSLRMQDTWGNLVPSAAGRVVTMSTNRGTLGAVSDMGDGLYRATLTSSTAAGVATLGATFDGGTLAATAQVPFVPGPPVASRSVLSATPTSIMADGTSASAIRLELRDAFDNPLISGGHDVAFHAGVGDLAPHVDVGDGTYTTVLTSLDPGTAVVAATIAGSPVPSVVVEIARPTGPMAVIQMQDGPLCMGIALAIVGAAHHGPHPVTEFTFDYGDRFVETFAAASHRTQRTHTFVAAGDLTVRLDARFANGAMASVARSLTVHDCSPPVGGFTFDAAGLTVVLRSTMASPGGFPLTLHWQLWDGTTSAQPQLARSLPTSGEYRVQLLAADSLGGTRLVERVVTIDATPRDGSTSAPDGSAGLVSGGSTAVAETPAAPAPRAPEPVGRPPVAVARADGGRVGMAVVLDGSASHDPDGAELRYAWVQLSGPTVVVVGADTATASFAPRAPGTYGFRLTVRDADGRDETEVALAVETAPTLAALVVAAPSEGGTLLSAVATGTPPGATFTWRLPNGVVLEGREVVHRLPPGTHMVRLDVRHGNETVTTHQVVDVAAQGEPEARPQAVGRDVGIQTSKDVERGWWLLGAAGAVVAASLAAALIALRRR